jgi:hypothetical protein
LALIPALALIATAATGGTNAGEGECPRYGDQVELVGTAETGFVLRPDDQDRSAATFIVLDEAICVAEGVKGDRSPPAASVERLQIVGPCAPLALDGARITVRGALHGPDMLRETTPVVLLTSCP